MHTKTITNSLTSHLLLIVLLLLIFQLGTGCTPTDRPMNELTLDTDQIQSILAPYDDPTEPGMLIAIYQHGKPVYKNAFGMARLGSEEPITTQHAFPIGSISKEFTMAGIMQEIDRGIISADDTIGTYVPGLRFGSEVTIKDLLSHTNGIPNFFGKPGHFQERIAQEYTLQELIDYFAQDSLQFAPGDQYEYGNSDYVLLASILTKLHNTSWPQYLQKNFFDPLEMKETYSRLGQARTLNTVLGYDKNGNVMQPALDIHPSQTFGIGSVVSTADDLYDWHMALFRERKLLSADSYEQSLSVYKLNNGEPNEEHRGYSIMSGTMGGHRFYWNCGDLSGIHTRYVYFPEEDLYICLVANMTIANDHDHAGNTMFKIAGAIFNEPDVYVIGRTYVLDEL